MRQQMRDPVLILLLGLPVAVATAGFGGTRSHGVRLRRSNG